ncbi:N-formylglutamate amidohydrolase [Lignipirellula cremea]|uniref:N-formylglutamate amidohydrolase n=1 Tax=Lignipirellula cremea TaxID=2528010 RepID=A0A518DP51_9BACT|nr:N-formylglutamate amidohydrolase [Lignipirellula cremea]QDU93618.1 N-formylglutamate amidohydrolase [Lignipirellula cremea]
MPSRTRKSLSQPQELRHETLPTWTIDRGFGPLVATAIHDGGLIRPQLLERIALDEAQRLREEDPCTGEWTAAASNQVIVHRSRFETDLNRPREKAVYQTPADAWNLEVWREPPAPEMIEESLALYDAFYRDLGDLLTEIVDQNGQAVVLDLHSYNHCRLGADQPADPRENPDINLGTGSMDRELWDNLVDRFLLEMRQFPFPQGPLNVGENVKFQGGEMGRWIHRNFPDTVCCLSVEVKKIYMDEWTGEPLPAQVKAIGEALRCASQGLLEEIHLHA